MGDAEDDSFTLLHIAHLSYEEQARFFFYNVCALIMDELHEIFPSPVYKISRATSKYPKEIYTVAKAATLIAERNKERTMSTIYECPHTLASKETLEDCLRIMSESYFMSILDLGEEHFFFGILTYCAIISLIADYLYNDAKSQERGQVCRDAIVEYMTIHLEERYRLNQWNDLVEASTPLSRLYDTKKISLCKKTDNPK